MTIVIGGMISLGKSSLATYLGEELGTKVFYESVDDNPILPLFYTSTPEEIERKRYPFLLQLYFLKTRFASIKNALVGTNNIQDRSIYEDWLFAKVNKELGRINQLEFEIYEGLLEEMLNEIDEIPKKSPDLMVYLMGDFDLVLERIKKRGRSYELSDDLKDYYYAIWKEYDSWVLKHYKASEILVINCNEVDFVNNEEDRKMVLDLIKKKIGEIKNEKEK